MRSRVRDLIRSAARGVLASIVVVTGLIGALLMGAGTASAASPDQLAQSSSATMTFGLLGPVGVVTVVLGVIGMAAGTARRRKQAAARAAEARRIAARVRAAQYAHPEETSYPVPRPSLPPLVEQPTRRIEPARGTRVA